MISITWHSRAKLIADQKEKIDNCNREQAQLQASMAALNVKMTEFLELRKKVENG